MNLIGSAGDASVTLQWSAVPGATGYRVYRDSTLVAQTTATGVTVGGLTNGTVYQFDVTAYTAFGESVPSNPLTLTPRAPTTSTDRPAPRVLADHRATADHHCRGVADHRAPAHDAHDARDHDAHAQHRARPARAAEPFTVVPATGPASGGTTIVVSGRGNVPHAGLSIDGAFATITGFTANSVTATTTIHVVPGTYDVVLYDLFGNQTIVPAAFTYQPVAGLSPAPTTTTTVPAPTTTRPNPTSTTRAQPDLDEQAEPDLDEQAECHHDHTARVADQHDAGADRSSRTGSARRRPARSRHETPTRAASRVESALGSASGPLGRDDLSPPELSRLAADDAASRS